MAITQITGQVVSANTVSADLIASGSLATRHYATASITADKLAANTATEGPLTAAFQANDHATYLTARGGIVGANTAITNLVTGLNGSNTRLVSEESNVLALQSGLQGSNVNILANHNNVLQILNGSDNVNIGTGDTIFTIRKVPAPAGIGIANVNPVGSSLTIGTPANIILNYGVTGNVVINNPVPTTAFNLDVHGTANTGALTATSVSASGIEMRSNDHATYLTAKGGIDGANTSISNITDGTTAFTDAVTMNDDLTILGNLTVAGSFANLAVQDSFTDDRIIFLANNFTGSPSLDAGLLINRGSSGNLFIGYDESEDYFISALNNDPPTNTAISIASVANFRTNLVRSADGSASTPAYSNYGDENTGMYFSGADTINFATAGVSRLQISSTGVTTTSGSVQTTGSLSATVDIIATNAAIAATVFSNGVELRANDHATYLAAKGGIDGANTNIASNDTDITNLITGLDGSNTNILSVTSNVGLSNNAVTTAFQANDFITFTRINANLNLVSSNADSKLDLSGGTMTGEINMGSSKITNLGTPTALTDAATKSYTDSLLGSSIVPTYTINTASGTSNVFAIVNGNPPADFNKIQVFLGGSFQAYGSSNAWVHNIGNNSIQFTSTNIPAGLEVAIWAWATP